MACAQGSLAKLAMKEASGDITWASGATGFPFFRESLKKKGSIVHPDVIIGSREEVSERARKGPNFYGGWVVLALTPGHMATVFPWLLGADASGTTFALSDSLQTFGVLVDKVTGVHEFYNGAINRAIIHGSQSGPGGRPNWITVALQMLFRSYNGPSTADSYPTLTLDVTGGYVPMVMEDASFTLGGSSREVKEFTLDINNYIQPRYVNSLDPTALCPRHRTVKLAVRGPYDSGNSDLYDQALAGSAGTLAVTNGTVSFSFAFATLQVPAETPEVPGKVELDLVLNHDARKASTTSALVCTIDSTP